MSKPKVLIVDGDEWIARMLADGLRDRGFEVRVALTGSDGLHAFDSVVFDCVVVDPRVPGLGGFSFVRSIRRAKGNRAKVPVIFLSSVDNDDGRAAAFQAGGDVYLTKPFRLQEVAIQVKSLVRMARRMSGTSVSSSNSLNALPTVSPSPGTSAFEGDLEQMSLASVLTLLEMERRSGRVSVRSEQGSCTLQVGGGAAVDATLDGEQVDPLVVVGKMLQWKSGRFRFEPGEPPAPVGTYRAIGHLLLEATRLFDESTAGINGPESSVPSSRTSWPPPSTWAKKRKSTLVGPAPSSTAHQPAVRRPSTTFRPPRPGQPSKPPTATDSRNRGGRR